MSFMSNGVVRVKITYPLEEHSKFLNLVGISKIEGHRVLTQLLGYPLSASFVIILVILKRPASYTTNIVPSAKSMAT